MCKQVTKYVCTLIVVLCAMCMVLPLANVDKGLGEQTDIINPFDIRDPHRRGGD